MYCLVIRALCAHASEEEFILRRLVMSAAAFTILLVFAPRSHADTEHEMAGAHDSPLISRFAGSVIVGYRTVEFDQLTLPLGRAVSDSRLAKTETVEGSITQIAYAVPPGKSAFEVAMNYKQALAAAGFKTRFACSSEGDGSNSGPRGCGYVSDMSGLVMPDQTVEAMTDGGGHGDRTFIEDTVEENLDRIFVRTAHANVSGRPVDVTVVVGHNAYHGVGVLLEICEGKAMATGEVLASTQMLQALSSQGHIALYGIHFESDSARLTPTSDPTLQRMVEVMKSHPELKVYIVGSTDDTGTLVHNLALSKSRAESVVAALGARGIASARMAAEGIASFAPVASNATAAGRAKNRRVELVEQ